jgi:hypothetical protein
MALPHILPQLVFKEPAQQNLLGSYPFSPHFTSTGEEGCLICAATAWHRSCTGEQPTHAGPHRTAVSSMPLLADSVLR